MPPISAIGSARSFSFSCNGVECGSPQRAVKLCTSDVISRPRGKVVKGRTHHATTIETLLTDGDDDVLAIAFKNLGTGNSETTVWAFGTPKP